GWAAAWATLGPSWFLAAAGATVGALVAVPWWRAHYIPNTPAALVEETTPVPVAVERTDAEVVQDRWAKRVANAGTLAKSRLELVETNGRVHKFVAHLVPGKQTYTQLASAREAIASAMQVPEPCVTIERCDHTASARRSVITDDNNDIPVMYTGPRVDTTTGLVGLGCYVDTSSESIPSMTAQNSAYGAPFCSDQGSGKSPAM